MRPIDALLVFPQDEEEDGIRCWLPGIMNPANMSPMSVRWQFVSGISIGVFSIRGMGGVTAATEVGPVLERYRPKLVLLAGIAAGRAIKEGQRVLGSVGYSNNVYYVSYGKINDLTSLPQIRTLPEVGSNEWLKRAAGQVNDQLWVKDAKRWHKRFRLEWTHRFEGYPRQIMPRRRLNKLASDVASGELVVANKEYQDHVRAAYPAARIQMFEMEAFAVAAACKRFGIPFLTVRGISDDGTADKDNKDKDRLRLWAILASVAFCKQILTSPEVTAQVDTIERPLANDFTRCLDPRVTICCPHQTSCVDGGIRVPHSTRNDLIRVYEGVKARQYSQAFEETWTSQWKDARVLFTFPYSPEDLLGVLAREIEDEGARNAVELFRSTRREYLGLTRDTAGVNGRTKLHSTKLRDELVHMVEGVTEKARVWLPHFSSIDNWCMERLKILQSCDGDPASYSVQLARSVGRILILDSEPDLSDPVYWLYLRFLGLYVPTYWTLRSELYHNGLTSGDVILVERSPRGLDLSTVEHDNWLFALRFFDSAELLTIAGWLCTATGRKGEDGAVTAAGLSALYKAWIRHLSGVRKSGPRFRPLRASDVVRTMGKGSSGEVPGSERYL